MALLGFIDAKKAQCVLWNGEAHGFTAFLQKVWSRYRKSAATRSCICRCYGDYLCSGRDSRIGKTGGAQTSDDKKTMMRTVFNGDPMIYLRTAATQIGLHHTTIWSFLKRELKL